MHDRDVPHKNPARVPMVLQAMDTAAHDEPRHILTTEGTIPMAKIDKDGVYKDADGNFYFMAAGDATALDVDYVGEREPDAPEEDPAPVVEADEERAKPAAPENKSRSVAPETKAKKD